MKVYIEFTEEQNDKIMKYMESVEAETIQDAVMNAISIALDEQFMEDAMIQM